MAPDTSRRIRHGRRRPFSPSYGPLRASARQTSFFLSGTGSNVVSASSLDGKASHRHGHRSRVGRDFVAEPFGTGAGKRPDVQALRPVPESASRVPNPTPEWEGIIFPDVS